MNDVTFSRNERDADTWRLHRAATAMSGVSIPGAESDVYECLFLY